MIPADQGMTASPDEDTAVRPGGRKRQRHPHDGTESFAISIYLSARVMPLVPPYIVAPASYVQGHRKRSAWFTA